VGDLKNTGFMRCSDIAALPMLPKSPATRSPALPARNPR